MATIRAIVEMKKGNAALRNLFSAPDNIVFYIILVIGKWFALFRLDQLTVLIVRSERPVQHTLFEAAFQLEFAVGVIPFAGAFKR